MLCVVCEVATVGNYRIYDYGAGEYKQYCLEHFWWRNWWFSWKMEKEDEESDSEEYRNVVSEDE